jgi:hypothetical protein
MTIEKLFNVVYNPNILIADGAGAITNGFQNVFRPEYFIRIMCWIHMLRNVEKQLNSVGLKEYKEQIISGIKIIQKSFSKEHFNYSIHLFTTKWQSKHISEINSFLHYFDKEWISSSNCGWYEGMHIRIPKQNNALKANNLVIKTHHTLRSRLSLSHYLHYATTMLNQRSIDRTKPENIFQHSFEIDSYWSLAYTWLKENGFIVGHVLYVTINELNWHYRSCTCSFFQKNYFCSHIISVAVSVNLVKIPSSFKNMVNIEPKPKRGRKPYALKALQKQ